MGYCCAVVVESASCKFSVDFIEASWLAEPVFFPEFLDDAFAGFCSWWWGLAFGYLG
jgi:hypothetical protein